MAGQMRNRIFTDLYEPGSTFKTMTMAYVLEKNTAEQLPKKIQTAPGQWKVGKNIIKDVHDYGRLSIGEVLVKSSNIAIAKLLLGSPSGFVPWLQSTYQIGQAAAQIFPGMPTSTIHDAYRISDFDLATIGFGYGVSITPLQLSQIYLSIANGGYWVNPRLTYTTEHQLPGSQRVLAQKLQDS